MRKRRVSASLLLLAFLLVSGCGGPSAPQAAPTPEAAVTPAPTPAPTPTPEPTPTPDPIAARVAAMTVEEKVGQLLIAGIEGTEPGDDAVAAIREFRVGGVILFGRNVADADQLAALTDGLKALNGGYVPLFLCIDEEGGRVSRMPPEIRDLPSALTFGRIRNPEARLDACLALGTTLAEACAAFGFNVDFAPSLDVWSNPENTVIGDRAFGADADTVSACGNQVVSGLMGGGVIPVVKHFPGHGDTLTDSHVGLPVVEKTVEELEELELKPFRRAVEEGAPAVMVAHILMREIDDQRPASLSRAVVTGLLREEMGFAGVVFTDDLTMGAVSDTYGMGEASVLAVEAGCDALLVCHGADNLRAAREALLASVAEGRITEERLNESVYRLLDLKEACGLTSEAVPAPDVDALNRSVEALLARLG